ncbi:MAG: YicC/YloC family endoribonuclease, partial [Bacteroidaceae bacterium]|nr:YicC/YloC family endoribonuclease [Bacteroidaceae bacterium]
MILSMTGYGKASAEYQGKKITAEIRSLNSKALDLSTRLAPAYREKEMEIRGMIAQALERGKVEFNLWIEQTEGPAELPINAVLAEAYHRQIQGICQQYGIPEPADWMPCLLRMPDVMARTQEVAELTAEEWNAAKEAIAQAIGQLMDFRTQEGAALQSKFCEKLDNIARLLESIAPYEQERVQKIRQRIVEGLQSIPEVEYDRNRLEQEMIYYIE